MPNWCENRLEVRGKEADVDRFAEGFVKNGISAFVPTPKELVEDTGTEEENMKKYGAASWYDWRLENWGTKWDITDVYTLERDEGYAAFSFDTAWAPPIEAFEKISKMFPGLEFILQYEEPLMGFFGQAVFKDGGLVEDDEYEWDERFEDGWWLYKEIRCLLDEADDILTDLLNAEQITPQEMEEIETIIKKLSDDKIRKVLKMLDNEDIDGLKKFLKKLKEY